MKKPVIYYRRSLMSKNELDAASKYFECFDLITSIPNDSFVISRYSLWPYFSDTEREFKAKGCQLINSFREHEYVADMKNWTYDLIDHTPATWFRLQDLPEDGPFVVKGSTNSKKFNWKNLMFAQDKKEANIIHSKLLQDSLISEQSIYFRKYLPLKRYLTGLNDLPVTKEFRFFVAFGKVISSGYYWSNYVDELSTKPDPAEVPTDWLVKIISLIGNNINFYTIDVAQTESGEWIVIELNDGCQSGLSENDPDVLYKNLLASLE